MRSLILLVALSLAAAFVPAHAQRTLPGLSEGVHYRHVGDGRPYAAQPAGTVEVAEVFAYTCPHCAKFAPLLEQWKATLPKHARLVLVPAGSGREDAWARVFFAAQAAKSQAVLHPRLFAASGAWLGWTALPTVLLGATLLALGYVLVRQVRGHRLGAQDALPFGPFLAAATWGVWLWGL